MLHHRAELAGVQSDYPEAFHCITHFPIRSHDDTTAAFFSCEPDNHAVRFLAETPVNDANSIAIFFDLVNRTRPPTVKNNRDMMAFGSVVAREFLNRPISLCSRLPVSPALLPIKL
jgi:hypothetical protein